MERQVSATYKGLWTKLLKNAEHRRAKITKKRFKGLDQPPHYRSPTVQYTYERNYTFQCESRVSRRIEQRERRFKLQANHSIAKQIITKHPHALIGLENLTDIRERTKRKKRRRKKNGKGYEPVSPRARKANRVSSQWSFAELQALISYKATLVGFLTVKVDADYTSKACPKCGHTADENRPKKGLRFMCQQCGHCLHADLIGARNIILRTLLIRQDWIRTGCLSIIPDTSDKEAKAARLRRYAELRWSPEVTSSLRSESGDH